MNTEEKIASFLSEGPWAVVGASTNRAKYGNKILRCYLQHAKEPLCAVHPRETEIEGVRAFSDLASLPKPARAVSVITPPSVTERVVESAIAAGADFLWMQPGAESERAIRRAEEAGLRVIAGGPCLLVELGYRDDDLDDRDV